MAFEFGSQVDERIRARDKLVNSPVWDELKAIYAEIEEIKESIKLNQERIKNLHQKAADTRREHRVTIEDELYYIPRLK